MTNISVPIRATSPRYCKRKTYISLMVYFLRQHNRHVTLFVTVKNTLLNMKERKIVYLGDYNLQGLGCLTSPVPCQHLTAPRC
jgi:hypothetical protein